MARDYLAEKAAKRKTGQKALWALIILLVVVISMIVKIMLTGSLKPDSFTGMPTNDDAYSVAKEFIQPTLKGTGADFDHAYQFAKEADSVYVIKSSVTSSDPASGKITTHFKAVMKYNGGQATKSKNWSLINLDQD